MVNTGPLEGKDAGGHDIHYVDNLLPDDETWLNNALKSSNSKVRIKSGRQDVPTRYTDDIDMPVES